MPIRERFEECQNKHPGLLQAVILTVAGTIAALVIITVVAFRGEPAFSPPPSADKTSLSGGVLLFVGALTPSAGSYSMGLLPYLQGGRSRKEDS